MARKITRKTRKATTEQDEALTPAEEYRAALADFTSYSADNETVEAAEARERFETAARRRRWWHF